MRFTILAASALFATAALALPVPREHFVPVTINDDSKYSELYDLNTLFRGYCITQYSKAFVFIEPQSVELGQFLMTCYNENDQTDPSISMDRTKKALDAMHNDGYPWYY